MGSDLTVKNSHRKTVSRPVKQKGAKVAFDFTKPISFSGKYNDGGDFTYNYNPDGVLVVCNLEEKYCGVAKDTDKNGKFDITQTYSYNESTEGSVKSFEMLDENNPENDVQTFAKKILADLQQQNKEYKPPKIDIKGKIGHFQQQGTGDCGLLASTLALSFTFDGKKIIKDSIRKARNGDVHVKLKGINETYNVSLEEIDYWQGRLSKGNDDMRAIELALEKERIKSAKKRLELKKLYPDRVKDIEDYVNKELETTITGIHPAFVFSLLTKGRIDEACSYNWDVQGDAEDPFQPPVWKQRNPLTDSSIAEVAKANKEKTKNILDNKMKYPERFAVSTTIIPDIKAGGYSHAVAIKRVDKKNVVYVNPWDSRTEVKKTRDEFMEDYNSIIVCDLKTHRKPTEKYLR